MRGVLPLTSLAVRILNLRSPPESSPFFLQAIIGVLHYWWVWCLRLCYRFPTCPHTVKPYKEVSAKAVLLAPISLSFYPLSPQTWHLSLTYRPAFSLMVTVILSMKHLPPHRQSLTLNTSVHLSPPLPPSRQFLLLTNSFAQDPEIPQSPYCRVKSPYCRVNQNHLVPMTSFHFLTLPLYFLCPFPHQIQIFVKILGRVLRQPQWPEFPICFNPSFSLTTTSSPFRRVVPHANGQNSLFFETTFEVRQYKNMFAEELGAPGRMYILIFCNTCFYFDVV